MRYETTATVLLVDDDRAVRDLLAQELDADGYSPVTCGRLGEAEAHLIDCYPDIAILDVGLPDGSGLALLRMIRDADRAGGEIDPDLPVLVLSGNCGESDRVRAFELGADDFLAKPFSYRELRGRVAAILRRREGAVRRLGPVTSGRLELDPVSREAHYDGEGLVLTQKEFNLLHQLATDPTRVFTKDELLRSVWGMRAPGATTTRTLDSHASRLRGKLKEAGAPAMIENVWGVGYRLLHSEPLEVGA